MKVKNLQLINYRNYENLYIEFNDNINLLIGENGQGKTNIVEAVYMLSFGKSFRTSKDKEIIKFETDKLYAGGSYEKNGRSGTIELMIGKSQKGIKVNKIPIIKLGELLGNINAVIFSPEDLKLVKDGPKERRSFIDREISQIIPGYYSLLIDYNKILSSRNKLLKGYNIDRNLLDVYDESLSVYGAKIALYRREFINKIAAVSKDMHKKLTGGKENLSVVYKNQIDIKSDDNEHTAADKFRKLLSEKRENDIELSLIHI